MLGSIRSWPRSRTTFQWFLLLFFPTILLCFAGIWFAGHRSLEKKLNAIRVQGLPTCIEELNDYYSIPEGVVDSTELWLAAYKAIEIADVSTKGEDLPFVGIGDTPVFDKEWADFAAAKVFIDDLETELELIYKAAEAGGQIRYPVVFSVVDFDTSQFIQESRGVARLLSLAAHVHAREGHCDAVFKDVKAIFSLANALEGEVSVIPVLIKNAIRSIGTFRLEEVLPKCQWSDEQLLDLQQIVMQTNLQEGMVRGLNGERASVLTNIDQFPITALKTANKHSALDYFEKTLAGTSAPWSEILENQKRIEQQLAKQSVGTIGSMKNLVVSMLTGADDQFIISNMRAVAKQRCLNAALAARRFQLEHGELPQSLDEIPHELLITRKFSEDLLTDPFDGKQLRYLLTTDEDQQSQRLIYSVGENEQDDGGLCPRDDETPAFDIGFWLNVKD